MMTASQNKGWLIGVLQDHLVQLVFPPKVYETEELVNTEIESLALKSKDQIFVKLKIENFVACSVANWT
jgi:uncharacterized protein YqfA (UPF0365 family)